MKLIKTLVEPIAISSMSYTPFPLQYEYKGLYTYWETKKLIEFKYEVN